MFDSQIIAMIHKNMDNSVDWLDLLLIIWKVSPKKEENIKENLTIFCFQEEKASW